MASYLNGSTQNPIPELIRRSWPILEAHPVNAGRRQKGLKEANSIWLWGQGRAPRLPLFFEQYGLRGGVISAVDLIKGIGTFAGFTPIEVEGATGYLDTNYLGKAEAALEGLETLDFIFLHVEAPDEASHNGNIEEKIEAIEQFDHKVVGTVLRGLRRFDDYAVMVASDHLTPIPKRTHTDEPTPFAWTGKAALASGHEGPGFTESSARASGLYFEKGHEMMRRFVEDV
jgi:2,3-bisphosphoglycerate-independent phosphoglycerate mutase